MLRQHQYAPLSSGAYVTLAYPNPKRIWITVQNGSGYQGSTSKVAIFLGEQQTFPYAYLDAWDSITFSKIDPFDGAIVAYASGDAYVNVSEESD